MMTGATDRHRPMEPAVQAGMSEGIGADVPSRERIRAAALAFIDAAFESLKEENVLPTPSSHPYIEIGRDYYGGDVMPLAEFGVLSTLLERAYPERFAYPQPNGDPEFTNAYIFSLLEACVAGCGIEDHPYSSKSPPIQILIDQLLAVLDSDEIRMACCREVSHLTTADGNPLEFGDLSLVPESDTRHTLIGVASSEVPGAIGTFNRKEPRNYDPPKAMLVVRATAGGRPYQAASRLIGRIERFLLLARLLYASTAQSYWQVYGSSTLVSRIDPVFQALSAPTAMGPLVRRIVRLTSDDIPAFEQLGAILDTAEVKREGMATTSFDVALDRYLRSFRAGNGFDAIIDLTTALEAVLTGNDTDSEAISLRLRTRAAALLSTEIDGAEAIFKDIGRLYGIRSKILHGGSIKEKDLQQEIAKISTVPDGSPFGIAVAYAVDRMQDLVRRSILARLCLATEPDPLWPFDKSVAVDARLSDDTVRRQWREAWRERMTEIGAAGAAERARAAVEFISQEDR